MKITSAKVFLVESGYVKPIIVELTTDEGITGIGEAAIAYGLGATAAAGMIKDLCERLIVGQDPFRIEQLFTEMYDHSFWAKGGGAIVFSGISAIEQALWDIKGKATNLPVYEFFGGKVFDEVPVYANGWNYHCLDADSWAHAAERPIADGYRALKCYPLATQDSKGRLRHVTRRAHDREFMELAYQRVKKLVEVAGSEVEIYIDLSGGLTTDESIRLIKRYEDLGITWIEEPCDAFDVGAMAKIAGATNTSMAAGERLYTRQGFRRLIEKQVVDIVQPDVGNTGGLSETKKIAAMAEAYNMRVAPHNCASMLCTAATLQVSVTMPNFMTLEIYPYFPDSPKYVQVLENPLEDRIKGGKLVVPSDVGLGVTLNQKNVAPYLWAECKA
ncbi:mandelate racemase/muconate lactonizing enzyme family protein [Pseudomonas sp. JM0905a]|uniref:mandelate racemase/muconate lactonizing enzyme family protein n=1 Tax=Pseudomonas sp. JM0905a TaxID=2772484 RepID=UPI00168365F9|nr:mandelate racemase/muconate lactonizing enzyme family protein [Pseudomonas sp. JM0905a]MBD2837827.1 mandelate racemase/muconate lactonizing enzyme family protein [Pseudomonas sp. JM0905a]